MAVVLFRRRPWDWHHRISLARRVKTANLDLTSSGGPLRLWASVQ